MKLGHSSRSTFFRRACGLAIAETETNLATLGRGTCLALAALFWGFVSAETANFLEDALHLEFGLQTLERTIDGLTFTDLDFGHVFGTLGGVEEKGAQSRGGLVIVNLEFIPSPNASWLVFRGDLVHILRRVLVEFIQARLAAELHLLSVADEDIGRAVLAEFSTRNRAHVGGVGFGWLLIAACRDQHGSYEDGKSIHGSNCAAALPV